MGRPVGTCLVGRRKLYTRYRSDHEMKGENPNPKIPKVVMVPVPKEDFRKINDLAEASWIAKDPNNVQTIRELRRNLLKEHNQEVIAALQERNRAREEQK